MDPTRSITERAARVPAGRHVLVAGPTASGKSALAAQIAARGGGIIVNADALQVYDRWRLLTARPSAAEEAALPHRLYGHVGRDGAWSVGDWLREVAALLAGGERLVIVGGTGLYFAALTGGLAAIPPVLPETRQAADTLLRDGGLRAMTAALDPETRALIDTGNPVRVQRAWEVLEGTGRGLARWWAETGPPLLPLDRTEAILLHPGRDWLAARIDERLDAMVAGGVLEEARRELPFWQPTHPSARAIGAAQFVAHLRGEADLAQAVAQAKAATRRYAAVQRKWFRRRMGGWSPLSLP